MTTTFMKRAVAAAAACLIATGAVTAVAEDTPPEPAEVGPTEGGTADNAPVEDVQYQQARRFAELRRDQRSGDAMPRDWERALEQRTEAEERWGANPELARQIAPGVWLIPGDGFVCVANMSPRDGTLGYSCATPADVEQGLLQPSDVDHSGNGVVTGVMADGVESVTIVDIDGSRREVAVDRNVYRAPIDARTKEVRWTDAAGVERSRPLTWIAP